jgi:3-hydroxyisobutyrate dehydrogenase-like beta-hydroxyacid dehydrogenase
MTDTIGLVGLGFIGASIGERLLTTGPAPVVFDLDADRVEALVTGGAIAASSVADLAERCDVVLVCVQTDEQCVDVVTGPGGLLGSARGGTVVVVLSTISPHTVEALAAPCAEVGVALLEAPMAGQGAKSVADGSMFVLAGGDDAVLARARPTLERFSRVIPTGLLGSAAALKLAHNVMVYVSRVGALEAVELARAAGVRDGLVAELTAQTGTLSEQSEVWLGIYEDRRRGVTDPVMDRNMVTAADLFAKDLGHAVALGAEHGLDLSTSAAAIPLADQVYLVREHAPPGERGDST